MDSVVKPDTPVCGGKVRVKTNNMWNKEVFMSMREDIWIDNKDTGIYIITIFQRKYKRIIFLAISYREDVNTRRVSRYPAPQESKLDFN